MIFVLAYCLPAVVVFGITLRAFRRDPTTPNRDIESWLVVVLAAVLWPVAIPLMLRKKWQQRPPATVHVQTQESSEPAETPPS